MNDLVQEIEITCLPLFEEVTKRILTIHYREIRESERAHEKHDRINGMGTRRMTLTFKMAPIQS